MKLFALSTYFLENSLDEFSLLDSTIRELFLTNASAKVVVNPETLPALSTVSVDPSADSMPNPLVHVP